MLEWKQGVSNGRAYEYADGHHGRYRIRQFQNGFVVILRSRVFDGVPSREEARRLAERVEQNGKPIKTAVGE
ncbi:MAG TPA: hypothetical protein VHN11_10255 [Xanthobacteraceae bacterium]|jgi:hypothetical protein|nr:hypothetical protein [Xanthobacteraceae bacterium]